MNLLLNVDQATALRLGIDAPSSTITLDVDPADLTELEREVLAAVIVRGHDCTLHGIYREDDSCPPNRHRGHPLLIVRPDLDGLRTAIAVALTDRDQCQADTRAENEKRRSRQDAEIESKLREIGTTTLRVGLDRDGQPASSTYITGSSVTVTVPAIPSVYPTDVASAESLARLKKAEQTARTDRQQIIAATRDELEALTRTAEAEKAVTKAEYDALYARLPESLRQRDADGFAGDGEIFGEIRGLLRHDAGWPIHRSWSGKTKLDTLTDEEHDRFRRLRAEIPEGTSIAAYEIYDSTWRAATEDDEEDDDVHIDEDGEVQDISNSERVALISWTRGGVKVVAIRTLS